MERVYTSPSRTAQRKTGPPDSLSLSCKPVAGGQPPILITWGINMESSELRSSPLACPIVPTRYLDTKRRPEQFV